MSYPVPPQLSTPAETIYQNLKNRIIPDLKVDHLRTLLRYINTKTTGNKPALLERLHVYVDTHRYNLNVLEGIRNEASGLLRPPQRAQAPPQPRPNAGVAFAQGAGPSRPQPTHPGMHMPGFQLQQAQLTPTSATMYQAYRYRVSPFYDLVERIGQPKVQDTRSLQNPFRIDFVLSNEMAERIRRSLAQPTPDYALYLFVGPCDLPPAFLHMANQPSTASIPIEYPPDSSVYCNATLVPGKHTGMKKRLNTATPADITRLVNLGQTVYNKVEIRYKPGEKRYIAMVQLVRKISLEEITKRIRDNHFATKEQVLESRRVAQGHEDDDVIATADVVNLKDAVSRFRIRTPIRSSLCKHVQCFDSDTFFSMNETLPTWNCPVCARVLVPDQLICDGFFQDILDKTNADVESVEVQPDGVWALKAEVDRGRSSSSDVPTKREDRALEAIMLDSESDDEGNPPPPPNRNTSSGSHAGSSVNSNNHSSNVRPFSIFTGGGSASNSASGSPNGRPIVNGINNFNMIRMSGANGMVMPRPIMNGVNGMVVTMAPGNFRPQMPTHLPASTPPRAVVPAKRPVEVIDLTFSDDDDDEEDDDESPAPPPSRMSNVMSNPMPTAVPTTVPTTMATSMSNPSFPIIRLGPPRPAPPVSVDTFMATMAESARLPALASQPDYTRVPALRPMAPVVVSSLPAATTQQVLPQQYQQQSQPQRQQQIPQHKTLLPQQSEQQQTLQQQISQQIAHQQPGFGALRNQFPLPVSSNLPPSTNATSQPPVNSVAPAVTSYSNSSTPTSSGRVVSGVSPNIAGVYYPGALDSPVPLQRPASQGNLSSLGLSNLSQNSINMHNANQSDQMSPTQNKPIDLSNPAGAKFGQLSTQSASGDASPALSSGGTIKAVSPTSSVGAATSTAEPSPTSTGLNVSLQQFSAPVNIASTIPVSNITTSLPQTAAAPLNSNLLQGGSSESMEPAAGSGSNSSSSSASTNNIDSARTANTLNSYQTTGTTNSVNMQSPRETALLQQLFMSYVNSNGGHGMISPSSMNLSSNTMGVSAPPASTVPTICSSNTLPAVAPTITTTTIGLPPYTAPSPTSATALPNGNSTQSTSVQQSQPFGEPQRQYPLNRPSFAESTSNLLSSLWTSAPARKTTGRSSFYSVPTNGTALSLPAQQTMQQQQQTALLSEQPQQQQQQPSGFGDGESLADGPRIVNSHQRRSGEYSGAGFEASMGQRQNDSSTASDNNPWKRKQPDDDYIDKYALWGNHSNNKRQK
ncbi:hypothetical protein SmJEL517_g04030 [Synchytrium microbalum]|uniref:SP-RING-type domain-containing protein n=1 Tax=Synchytrium microbalum TaxID=1806994 RepID=A0A507C682_9FUNG|nr:uncharacterized protein SmJEL517_g04030 [Synchytrium microbalum]TPX32985.1 hypothetical protein SmJEL517_g04030 [Synchytrium microbalum]